MFSKGCEYGIKAIIYIATQSLEGKRVKIGDVVENSAVSRSLLEKRFRRIMGHSILNEIKRVKVNHIAKLLVETDLSVKQIARKMEYTCQENFCRYFRQVKGMSPLQYRKKYGGERCLSQCR